MGVLREIALSTGRAAAVNRNLGRNPGAIRRGKALEEVGLPPSLPIRKRRERFSRR
jgi:hypothetical protein